MRTRDWVRGLTDHPRLKGVLALEDGPISWNGAVDEIRPLLIAALYSREPRKLLIVAPSYDRCLKWQAKLALSGIPDSAIHQLPDGTSALFEDAAPEHIALSDRIGAIRALVVPEPSIVIATPSAALERTLPRDLLEEVFFEIRPGDQIEPREIVRKLNRLGYEPSEPVRIPGQHSQRGGILDVFPSGHDTPIRIEFFGDEVESIRTFDANSQRSIGKLPAVALAPSRETLFPDDTAAFVQMLQDAAFQESHQLADEAGSRLEASIAGDVKAIQARAYFDRLDLYRPMLHPDSGCAVDLLPDDGWLILDEPVEVDAVAGRAYDELADALASRSDRGEILKSPANDFMAHPDRYGAGTRVVAMSHSGAYPDWWSPQSTVDVESTSFDPIRGRADALAQALKDAKESGRTIIVCTDQPNRAKAVLEQVEVFPAELELPSFEDWKPGVALLSHGNIGGGFVLPSAGLAVFSDAEVFGVARLKLPQRRFMEGAPVSTVLDLKPGDYVVHIQFGVGIYRGLTKREVEGIEREFLYIEYAHPDKLYVPAEQLDRIQKYLNPGDSAPKVNRLTGTEWQKTLSKAKEDARLFAQDLVKLYAERKEAVRRPFGPDTPWQGEMESTFPWVETPGQIQAIRDVKRDLQGPNPMDRLVCGDVGFGKTEVAIRAAFKVVQDSRQVAILCPTTILSEQHARNFAERLESFGARVGLLNRFRSASERNQVLSDLKEGKLDILIGTHALLSKEIVFKDLGLVVIDEEQKFGVKQKEVLKKLRSEVDVLSMSATPIPRTLSMALMDIRQMSLINDPPPGRLPVRSFVRAHSKNVVKEAILRELARGGQVFYVYNRVQGIQGIAQQIQKLIPDARIGIGHGQMSEEQLEPVMIGFIKGEIDILLSTSIIENGIDISNANTLIVDNADHFGLSQLYQLRGRVGRSDRQAYAYFLYQSHKELSEGAFQRLTALQEFSSLGAGYSLAFRDLQIRGAGELLGAKQSGSMASVGYELYTQLINEQVALLKSAVDGGGRRSDELDEAPSEPLPSFDIPVKAYIPPSYIYDASQRLYYYQMMMRVRRELDLGEVRAEIEDRYGHLPIEVSAAFHILYLRIRAQHLGIEKVEANGGRIVATIRNRGSISPLALSLLAKSNREAYFARDQLVWPISGDVLNAADTMVAAIESAVEQAEEMRSGV